LIVRPDNTFEILIDTRSVKNGSLLSDFDPPVAEPREIVDPEDTKPSDWVDATHITDPDASKPDDWDETLPEFIVDPDRADPPDGWYVDESRTIPDLSAIKPPQWDDDLHGEWLPPSIPNPKCEFARGCGRYDPPLIKNPLFRGKWRAPTIPNPEYKGWWTPRKIPNPDFVEDVQALNFGPLLGAGFEFWAADKRIWFNNVYIGTDEEAVRRWNRKSFLPRLSSQVMALRQLWIQRQVANREPIVTETDSTVDQLLDSIVENPSLLTISIAAVLVLFLGMFLGACLCGGLSPALVVQTVKRPVNVKTVKQEGEAKVSGK
jgi:calnexin